MRDISGYIRLLWHPSLTNGAVSDWNYFCHINLAKLYAMFNCGLSWLLIMGGRGVNMDSSSGSLFSQEFYTAVWYTFPSLNATNSTSPRWGRNTAGTSGTSEDCNCVIEGKQVCSFCCWLYFCNMASWVWL